jgi:hypothetical protein
MSDSSTNNSSASTGAPGVSIAITPMHRADEGIWEAGGRDNAQLFLVELVQADGEDAEVIVECRDERVAALAARVASATIAAVGLVDAEDGEDVDLFDDETAAILADNPTPEVEAPSGIWTGQDEDDEADERPS